MLSNLNYILEVLLICIKSFSCAVQLSTLLLLTNKIINVSKMSYKNHAVVQTAEIY